MRALSSCLVVGGKLSKVRTVLFWGVLVCFGVSSSRRNGRCCGWDHERGTGVSLLGARPGLSAHFDSDPLRQV